MIPLLIGADVPGTVSETFPRALRDLEILLDLARLHLTLWRGCSEGLREMFCGSGSLVTVKFRRGADEKAVTLKRACTAELADKKRMFELL